MSNQKPKEQQIEVIPFPETDYKPLVEYEAWRVAVLRYCKNLDPKNVKTMQKHMYTDEVFVLTSGKCMLFCCGEGELPGEVEGVVLEPNKLYNVKKGVWHNHIMSEDGCVVIIENSDTYDADDNSPIVPLTPEQIKQVMELSTQY